MKKYEIGLLIVGFFLIGLFLPYGLNIPTPSNDYLISTNYTCFGCDDIDAPSILILLAVIIPIVIVVGLLCLYLPDKKEVDSNEITKKN